MLNRSARARESSMNLLTSRNTFTRLLKESDGRNDFSLSTKSLEFDHDFCGVRNDLNTEGEKLWQRFVKKAPGSPGC